MENYQKWYLIEYLRTFRGWDFTHGAGLIMVGSQRPWSRDVEISTDNGTTFQHLPMLPYGDNEGVDYPCVTIINDTTVFIAGGRSEGWVRHDYIYFCAGKVVLDT